MFIEGKLFSLDFLSIDQQHKWMPMPLHYIHTYIYAYTCTGIFSFILFLSFATLPVVLSLFTYHTKKLHEVFCHYILDSTLNICICILVHECLSNEKLNGNRQNWQTITFHKNVSSLVQIFSFCLIKH